MSWPMKSSAAATCACDCAVASGWLPNMPHRSSRKESSGISSSPDARLSRLMRSMSWLGSEMRGAPMLPPTGGMPLMPAGPPVIAGRPQMPLPRPLLGGPMAATGWISICAPLLPGPLLAAGRGPLAVDAVGASGMGGMLPAWVGDELACSWMVTTGMGGGGMAAPSTMPLSCSPSNASLKSCMSEPEGAGPMPSAATLGGVAMGLAWPDAPSAAPIWCRKKSEKSPLLLGV
mmetsp:Transcript_15037/g.37504  ORF Transcript_15037/g.37504 Transcript_15037/m.37504 type:complete len:232 (+) Transcript_15037:1144-1839(+)